MWSVSTTIFLTQYDVNKIGWVFLGYGKSYVGWYKNTHLAQQVYDQNVGLYEKRSAQPT